MYASRILELHADLQLCFRMVCHYDGLTSTMPALEEIVFQGARSVTVYSPLKRESCVDSQASNANPFLFLKGTRRTGPLKYRVQCNEHPYPVWMQSSVTPRLLLMIHRCPSCLEPLHLLGLFTLMYEFL